MLATRIIPVILYRGEQVVKGKKFDSWRAVGHVRQAIRLYNSRSVDEVFCLNIEATNLKLQPDFNLINDLASEMFCPFSVGGGMNTVDHFRKALANGADKIVINTAAIDNPDLINQASHHFGAQAVVVSVDVIDNKVYTNSGTRRTEVDPIDWVKECTDRGAGEILITSADRDGTMTGYDLSLIHKVACSTTIPVVACGGAGELVHFRAALESGAHGVAASSIFLFTDITPKDVAIYLRGEGYHTRIE